MGDELDEAERREIEMDSWLWTYCCQCEEDYRMPVDAGLCIICGHDLDEEAEQKPNESA